MNKNIIRDIFKLKMEILEGITEHLPSIAKERIDNFQHDIIMTISEVANEYLEKKKPDDENKHIKKVSIE
jgi:hypothetical protein